MCSSDLVAIVVLVILVIGFGAFSVWAYLQYMDQKKDVDGKIDVYPDSLLFMRNVNIHRKRAEQPRIRLLDIIIENAMN